MACVWRALCIAGAVAVLAAAATVHGAAIRAKHSGKVVEIPGGWVDMGLQLQQWDLVQGYAHQQWTPAIQSDGAIVFVSESNGLCMQYITLTGDLDVQDGGGVIQWRCTYGKEQRFYLDRQDDGSYLFRYRLDDSKCLDVYGVSQDNGGKLVLWQCHGGDNQRFYVDGFDLTTSDIIGLLTRKGDENAGCLLWYRSYGLLPYRSLGSTPEPLLKYIPVCGPYVVGFELSTLDAADVAGIEALCAIFYDSMGFRLPEIRRQDAPYRLDRCESYVLRRQLAEPQNVRDEYHLVKTFAGTEPFFMVDESQLRDSSGLLSNEVFQWEYNGGDNQIWRITLNNDGSASLASYKSQKCMGILSRTFPTVQKGMTLSARSCGGGIYGRGWNEGFRIEQWGPRENKTFKMKLWGYENLCLDVLNASRGNGVSIQVWDCDATPSQLFKIEPFAFPPWKDNENGVFRLPRGAGSTDGNNIRYLWIDGCSGPIKLSYRKELNAACNAHDICWYCRNTPGWNLDKITCDRLLYENSIAICRARFPNPESSTYRDCTSIAGLMNLALLFAQPGDAVADCVNGDRRYPLEYATKPFIAGFPLDVCNGDEC